MKRKHLLCSLALAAVFGACTQDDFVASVSTSETVSNDFGQYVGVPFEGDVNFTRVDDVQTRIGLDDNLDWEWAEGDRVGLVWLNSDAISSAIDSYDSSSETDTDVLKYIEDYETENGTGSYATAIQSGDINPEDGSYVWGLWPTNWKTFSNTLMTYESNRWHMTDGNIYKGMYMAYFPYQKDRQSTSKFSVTQNALQEQNATTIGNDAAENTIANHIVSSDPGVGMVWISENDGTADVNQQNSSFVYKVAEQDTESGIADEVNIRMRPFSDILDLRIYVDNGTVDEDVTKSIQIEAVELIATNKDATAITDDNREKTFATEATFDFSNWGSDDDNNLVYAVPTSNDGPRYYTYDVEGNDKAKYVEGSLVSEVKNSIQNPAANNGVEQRVQLMLLPNYQSDMSTALQLDEPMYWVRIYTDYGYIDIPELGTENGWRFANTSSTGVVVNPSEAEEAFSTVASQTDGTKNLNYIRTMIGQRATRMIVFDASDLTFDYITVCSTDELIETITKWNNLGKTNEILNVMLESEECTFEDLVWSETANEISVKTQTLTDENQLPEGTESFGTADEAIQEFIKNGNILRVNSDHVINIGGKSAIGDSSDQLVFTSKLNVTGRLGIADDVTLTNGMDIAEDGTVIISDSSEASLWVGDDTTNETNRVSSTWDGSLYLYQDGTLTLGRYASVTNNGDVHINGNVTLKGASTFTNDGEVYLYANAAIADGSYSTVPVINNNATIYYVDIIKNFDATITVNKSADSDIVASIIRQELGNHGDNYLASANAFGANKLIIEGVVISSEWNNLSGLNNFTDVELNGYVEWNLYNGIEMPNATVTVTGTVYLISNGRNAGITCENVVLAANAQLHVEVSEDATSGDISITCDGVTMNNNTSLYGYDYFSCSSIQPEFNGTGYHYIFDSEGNPMFGE